MKQKTPHRARRWERDSIYGNFGVDVVAQRTEGIIERMIN